MLWGGGDAVRVQSGVRAASGESDGVARGTAELRGSAAMTEHDLADEMSRRISSAVMNPLCDANVHCLCRFINSTPTMRDGLITSAERYECHRCGHQEVRYADAKAR